jgi:hypothetical protein
MRTLLISLSAMTLISLATPSLAEETHVLNCRLMTAPTPWLFRQHCKSDNFARLAVPDPAVADVWEKPKDHKKLTYNKRPYYKKKHAYKKDKYKHSYKLIWKLHYLEKKLYAELRNCKKNYQCIIIVKRKLAKLYKHPAYEENASTLASVGTTVGNTTGTLSGTAGSLTGTAGNTLSGTTNTVGGLAGSTTDTVGGVAGGATNTVGSTATGATNTVGSTATGATDTVGNTASGATDTVGNTVGGVLK